MKHTGLAIIILAAALAASGCDVVDNIQEGVSDTNPMAIQSAVENVTAANPRSIDPAVAAEFIEPHERTGVQSAKAGRFAVLHQGFNHGVTPWIDGGVSGMSGWCGSIASIDRRQGAEPAPSAGRGYAAVEFGDCNDTWTAILSGGAPGVTIQSGPASGPNPDYLSAHWPTSGFIQELDIYLDPDAYDADENGIVFGYTNALQDISDTAAPFPFNFNYFGINVTKSGSAMYVAGHEIDESGWYTFRHVFGSDDGTLTVDFELLKRKRMVVTVPITTTYPLPPGFGTVDVSTFSVSDLGNGYIWFTSITPGLSLPIDEQRLRPGG